MAEGRIKTPSTGNWVTEILKQISNIITVQSQCLIFLHQTPQAVLQFKSSGKLSRAFSSTVCKHEFSTPACNQARENPITACSLTITGNFASHFKWKQSSNICHSCSPRLVLLGRFADVMRRDWITVLDLEAIRKTDVKPSRTLAPSLGGEREKMGWRWKKKIKHPA